MDIGEATYLAQKAMLTIGMVCGPVLGVALVVGMIISLMQAVTQVQEMTIVFVPKIIAVFIVIALLAPWMLQEMVLYGQLCFTSIEDVTK